MKVITGTVVDGKVEVPPDVSEGSSVAILALATDEVFRLTEFDELQLSQAMEEIRAGKFVDGWALLDEIKAQSRD